MEPLKIAARFVAFSCDLNSDTHKPQSPEEAGAYARGHWKRFLPYVQEDLGCFLTGPRPTLNRPTRYGAGAGRRRMAV
jgi:hypothetical protein